MPTLTTMPFELLEGTTAIITWTFQDENDAAINNSALQTATLTLYDHSTGTIINTRDDDDILGGGKTGANNVVIASGVATWYVQSVDNTIISPAIAYELHIALVEWSWDPGDGNGVRQGKKEISILVTNLNLVP